ncbi:Uma2 family endonuclease [Oscillatoria sp. FACHB-1407]|uniref:Uma2 family endonuclease n=1 Tax=Oscillatoria sp. FACHB-1407 TaxID=2692847 RepID=UPI001686F43C|nr:Uma2 family endonuclease [Oscillatoria sp. FACHB-1407]MBD2463702.1 Uma2 family endonuclease [Oscillatoria sp. FACHB-1407]
MTSSRSESRPSQFTRTQPLPPLESGDRLTRPEFERRYHAMPEIKKAELIEGVVYMASPLRFKPHAEPHGRLITWLGVYQAATPQVDMGIEPTVRLDIDNEPQPDGVLLISPESGGRSTLSEDGYLEGAPELVAEVAASSVSIDLGDKKRAYRRNGIQEYIVWQVFDQKIDWFCLQDGDYVLIQPNSEGVICSPVFPGLWLDTSAMLQGNMQRVLEVLQTGISSTEHQTFVQQLVEQQHNNTL